MRLRQLSCMLVLALGVCLGREARAECTTDVECKGERICVEGACVDPPPKAVDSPTAPEMSSESSSWSGAGDDPTTTPMTAAPRMERRSQGLFVAGIVSLSLVPVAGLVSFVGMASKSRCEFDAETDAKHAAFAGRPAPPPANCGKHDGTLYGGLVGSAVLLGGGLTMLLIGVEKVPVERTGEVSVRPWLSPTTAGLGLSTAF